MIVKYSEYRVSLTPNIYTLLTKYHDYGFSLTSKVYHEGSQTTYQSDQNYIVGSFDNYLVLSLNNSSEYLLKRKTFDQTKTCHQLSLLILDFVVLKGLISHLCNILSNPVLELSKCLATNAPTQLVIHGKWSHVRERK